MDSIGDLKKDLNARLYERVSSPLYSTFIISWCITNWRLFYVTLFESRETLGRSKYYYIVNVLYPGGDCWSYFCSLSKLYFWPAILTFAIIWWLPKLLNLAYSVAEKYKSERRNTKYIIQGQTTVPGDVFLALKKKYEEQIDSFVQTLKEEKETAENLNEVRLENQKLENNLSTLEQQLNASKSQYNSLQTDFNSLQGYVGSLTFTPMDVFGDFWESRYIGSSGEGGQEIFTIVEGYKYMVASRYDFNKPDGFRLAFVIDKFYYNRTEKKATFKKVGVDFNHGVELQVELIEKNIGLWEGFERQINPIQPGFGQDTLPLKGFGEPIKLTYTRVVLGGETTGNKT